MPTPGPFGEDCLYLNVWTPAKTASSQLPVLVWIHGGGFTTGSGAKELYRQSVLPTEGAVVVTINYRLGPFGFLRIHRFRPSRRREFRATTACSIRSRR